MNSEILRMWFASHFHIDAKARGFYTGSVSRTAARTPEHINEYTVNASAIQAVVDVMADTVIMRRAKKGGPVNWNELAGAINYYREEFGHTLPVSVNRSRGGSASSRLRATKALSAASSVTRTGARSLTALPTLYAASEP